MAKMSTQTTDTCCIMLWGPAFGGKSVLASQFPNPHFVSLDPHTLLSVRGLKARYKLDFDVNIIDLNEDVTEDQDFIDATSAIIAKQMAWEKTLHLCEFWIRTLPQNATLVLDNITRGSEYLLGWIRKSAGRVQLQVQDWGVFVNQIEDLMKVITHSTRKCNVVVIAHEEVAKDPMTDQTQRYLLMPTKARYRIPSLTTDYLYMYTESKIINAQRVPVRMLKSQPTADAQVGSRILVPNIEFPTYEKIKPYLDAALGRELPPPNWTPGKDE